MRMDLQDLMRQIQDNQRNDWRLELSEPIRGWISSTNHQDSEGRTQLWIDDLSDHGLGIRTAQPIVLTDEVQLTFRWHGRTMTIKGTVAWSKEVTNPEQSFKYAYGIRLSSDDENQSETQRELIQKMIQVMQERHRTFESILSRIRRRTTKTEENESTTS